MNGSLKHWKEAATLILAAGHRSGPDGLMSRTPLAVACSHLGSSHGSSHLPPHASSFDYDVLMLKRSDRSGFMPNAHVFPGGMVEPSDFSREWLDVFKSVGNSANFGLASVKQPPETRPPIFATDRLKLGSPIPGEVALRVCALRETFEESGVLLVVPQPEEGGASRGVACGGCDAAAGVTPRNGVKEPSGDELARWRTLVHRSPSNFLEMCKELRVLPNIWALHEWSNWLTPEVRYSARRYDTAFFICCLQEAPHTLQDEKEIVSFQWSTPSEVLRDYQAKELWIAPPQFYELSRMCRFPLLSDLHSFSVRRATEGCERLLPVVVRDGHYISLLPGDRLYPLTSSGGAKKDASADPPQEDPRDCGLHRMLILDSHNINLKITITPKYNHLLPVGAQAVPHDLHSKC